MVRSDPTTSPIILANLNFLVFSEYLLSLRRVNKKRKRKKKRRRVVGVPAVPNLRVEGAAHDGVGDGGDGGDAGAASDSDDSIYEADQRYLSKSSYGSARSALVHLYRSCGASIPDDFQEDMANFMRGIKRKVATQKETSGIRAEEGKAVMSFEVYRKLLELMYESEDDEAIFGHLFLTLEWNLMARSDNVVHSHTNHLEWRDDCLLYYIMRSKGDQEGLNSKEP